MNLTTILGVGYINGQPLQQTNLGVPTTATNSKLNVDYQPSVEYLKHCARIRMQEAALKNRPKFQTPMNHKCTHLFIAHKLFKSIEKHFQNQKVSGYRTMEEMGVFPLNKIFHREAKHE